MGLEALGATRGVQGRFINRSVECDQGEAGLVEGLNYVTFGVIRWLLNFV